MEVEVTDRLLNLNGTLHGGALGNRQSDMLLSLWC